MIKLAHDLIGTFLSYTEFFSHIILITNARRVELALRLVPITAVDNDANSYTYKVKLF